MADPTPRIFIRDVDKLLNRMDAVATDMSRNTLRHGNDAPTDNENAMVIPRNVRLDDDPAGTALSAAAGKFTRTSSSDFRLIRTPRP